MALFTRLATLATAAEAARRYARNNPDKTGKILDRAAAFVDKQTKGRYRSRIDDAARKAKSAAGVPRTPGHGPTANGYAHGYEKTARTPER